jgi:hypothetical protein
MRYFNINLLIEFHIIYSLKDIDRLFFLQYQKLMQQIIYSFMTKV